MKKPLTILLLTAALVPQPAFMSSSVPSLSSHAAETKINAKLKFSEVFRKETVIAREVPVGTTATEMPQAARGTLKLSVDMHLPKEESAAFDAATPLAVKLGGFEFGSTLGSDPQYQPGKTTATLILAANSPSGNSRVILATAVLNWEREKLRIRIDADTPAGGQPVAAWDFLASLPGKVKAETTAQIQLGDQKTDIVVPFTGKITHKTTSSDRTTSVVVTVELKN